MPPTTQTSSPTSAPPSAITTLLRSSAPTTHTHPPPYHHLALQVLHNLQHQHDWTNLHIHTHSTHPKPPISTTTTNTNQPPSSPRLLPRPLVSGMPPTRIYVHPDEQLEMLRAGRTEQDVPPEREWVLPTRLREKWSLRRLADVFDTVEAEPDVGDEEGGEGLEGRAMGGMGEGGNRIGISRESTGAGVDRAQEGRRRRGGKRVLLATVSDDSTIVYYIVHEGLVKPRQN